MSNVLNKKLAIIPARGGSKRIPRKNIKEFCGKPIIEYSIRAAIEGGVDEVMVSTDDEEIAEIANKLGARVPFLRSAETASDFATTADVLNEVLSEYEKRGKRFDSFMCIYPTAPFITSQKIIDAMKIFEDKKASMVFSVVPFSFPPMRGNLIQEDGQLIYKWEECRNCRSQDLQTMYHDCGQFYIFRTSEFIQNDGMVKRGIYPFIVSELEAQDIDNEMDWQLAELKYKFMMEKQMPRKNFILQ